MNDTSYEVIKNKRDLTANKMTMVFDRTQWVLGGKASRNPVFGVDINAMLDYFDVSTNGGVEAKVGYETIVNIVPIELISYSSMESLDVEDRGCRYGTENPADPSLFKMFTTKACGFEVSHTN